MNESYPDSPAISSGQAVYFDNTNPTTHIIHLLDRPIAFHRCFVAITGSVTAALMLSQALYWQRRCKNPNGWWYKTRDDWREETGMERREQEGARRKLRRLQVLQEKRCGVPAQLWYRLDEEKLLTLLTSQAQENNSLAPVRRRESARPVGTKPPVQLVQNRPTGWDETAQQAGTKAPSKLAQNGPTPPFNTETTTETTTTTTTTNALAENAPASHNDSERGCGCSQEELIFDLNLGGFSREERERATKLLEGLNVETAQQVLDEFNEALGSKAIKKSRWAWLRRVAQTARDGKFEPTADLSERRRRRNQAAATQPPERRPSEIWRTHQAELLQDGVSQMDYYTYIAPLRGCEDGQTLWLEAPNSIVADWVRARLPWIEAVIRPHTPLSIQVCIG